MFRQILIGLASGVLASTAVFAQDDASWSIVVHGGAGVIERDQLDAETEAAYRDALNLAVVSGGEILANGGSALDAVEAVIRVMEDDPKFNAGRGAVFTSEGRNELDASIMRGSDMQAGAVSGVTQVRHPITLARLVMTDNPHVMLQGRGAETFAIEQGLEIVPEIFFSLSGAGPPWNGSIAVAVWRPQHGLRVRQSPNPLTRACSILWRLNKPLARLALSRLINLERLLREHPPAEQRLSVGAGSGTRR